MALIRAPIGEIVNSLYGSLRLACGDKNGMNYFITSDFDLLTITNYL